MVTRISDYFLYRWRYLLGYSVITLLVIALMGIAWLLIPGGLSESEMNSVVTSSSLTLSPEAFKPETIINLPYHILQRLSLALFDVSNLSIKLPSLILGLLSALGVLLLLRTWFKQNVAVITTILVITSGQFLFLIQEGASSIVYVFWSVWLLVTALMISRKARGRTFWKMALFGVGALSLYTPLAIYIIAALLSAVVLHPHLRYIVRNLSKPRLAIGFTCGIILLIPLAYAIARQPSIGLQLLGIPSSMPDFIANGKILFQQYFSFINPGGITVMTPIYGLGIIALIILGVIRLFTTKYTARGYIIISWSLLLIPLRLVNPQFISITFVPIILLMAMGVSMLISRWYRVFPRNPYARIAGLVPLAILIGGMVFSGIDRFIYGYTYTPQVAIHFSSDLSLLNQKLAEKDRGSTAMLVSEKEKPFYVTVAEYNQNLSVVTDRAAIPASTTKIVSHDAHVSSLGEPTQILTSDMSNQADRFYIYKTVTK
jgi:hypothetical protein